MQLNNFSLKTIIVGLMILFFAEAGFAEDSAKEDSTSINPSNITEQDEIRIVGGFINTWIDTIPIRCIQSFGEFETRKTTLPGPSPTPVDSYICSCPSGTTKWETGYKKEDLDNPVYGYESKETNYVLCIEE